MRITILKSFMESSGLSFFQGGCHCRQVRFQVQAPQNLICWQCNCSICNMKQNLHFIVPKARFRLTAGDECLSQYSFNTHRAKHYFCKTCGIWCFYIPRSNPDGVAVTVYCLDQPSDTQPDFNVKIQQFDGINWEQSMNKCNISNLSKLWQKTQCSSRYDF